MVEDMEENMLCFFRFDLLEIINNQYIDGLIEVYEIVHLVGAHRIGVLGAEGGGRDKQYAFFGVMLFYFQSDGRDQVRFPDPRRPVKEEGVEGLVVESRCNGTRNVERLLVAFALAKTFESVLFIEKRLHRFPLGRGGLRCVGRIGCVARVGTLHRGLSRVGIRVLVHFQLPLHSRAASERLVDGLFERHMQGFHHFFSKNSAGDADVEHPLSERVEFQRTRPCVEEFR